MRENRFHLEFDLAKVMMMKLVEEERGRTHIRMFLDNPSRFWVKGHCICKLAVRYKHTTNSSSAIEARGSCLDFLEKRPPPTEHSPPYYSPSASRFILTSHRFLGTGGSAGSYTAAT